MEPFEKHQPNILEGVSIYDITQINENVRRAIEEANAKPQNNDVLLENITLTGASTTEVEHRLGRRFRGWYVVDSTAAAIIHRNAASAADLGLFLPLIASVTTTVSLVIF